MVVILIPAGNKKSLVDAMESGVNLREEILQLYRQNYHGGVMKLVVIGGGEKFSVLFPGQHWCSHCLLS